MRLRVPASELRVGDILTEGSARVTACAVGDDGTGVHLQYRAGSRTWTATRFFPISMIVSVERVGESDPHDGPPPELDAVEFAVHLVGGLTFHTGGFNDIQSLAKILADGESIDGTFDRSEDAADAAWHATSIAFTAIVAIVDLRAT